MIDTHCHLNLYPDPSGLAARCDRENITAICVTNSPAAFEATKTYISGSRSVRIALGLHPLETARNRSQWRRFADLVSETPYIGEVGLDFSRAGIRTKPEQLEAFEFVLRSLQGHPHFMTVHSRRAESATLDLVDEHSQSPVVFHWYSGGIHVLKRAIASGHYFSINPAMVKSTNGRRIVSLIPRDRVLTETDGPFVKLEGRTAIPEDVRHVEMELGFLWRLTVKEVEEIVWQNFRNLLRLCGVDSGSFVES